MYLPDFLWKYKRPIMLILFVGLSCLLIIDSLHRRLVSDEGSAIVLGVAAPLQKASQGIYDGGRNVLAVIPDFFRTRAQNIVLRKRVGELEQQVVALKEQLRRDQRFRLLDDFASQTEGPRIIARVLGISPTVWFSNATVDKGSSDGVHIFSPALSATGLAGQVVEVHAATSKIILLTDSNCKVGVIVQRSRVRGVVQGNDEGGCVLKFLEATADVKNGDILLSSDNSLIYPSGLPVGVVGEIKSKPGTLFKWATVLPATDFARLEEVAIIAPPVSEPAPEGNSIIE